MAARVLPPTDADVAALAAWQDAYYKLQNLGWRDPIMAPRDGTPFEVITVGSVGVFRCKVSDDGFFNVEDGNNIYPQHRGGLLWRPLRKGKSDASS